jgi:outer membrane protein assembly factor BamD
MNHAQSTTVSRLYKIGQGKMTNHKAAIHPIPSNNLSTLFTNSLSLQAMMKSHVLRFLMGVVLAVVLLGTQACDPYNKLLKSSDLELKFTKAKEYYYQGVYYKAQPLLEELISVYRGSEKAEEVYYFYAYCDYQMGDYTVASYHFKNFATSFPSSNKVEEMDFMYAYCLYLESPRFSLDQGSTQKALEAFQLYINKYPRSPRLPECNRMMDLLRAKLERKAYESAMLFYKMEDYRASATMLKRTLMEFPDIGEREQLQFLVVKSYFMLAENSIRDKQRERYEECLKAWEDLKDDFPASRYLKEAKSMAEKSKKALKELEEEDFQKVKNQSLVQN